MKLRRHRSRISAMVRAGVTRPNWRPTGYYKNRPRLMEKIFFGSVGRIEGFALIFG